MQDARKAVGLDVSDRITVVLDLPVERLDWARAHLALIAGEILATSLEFGDPGPGATPLGDEVRGVIAKA